MHFTYGRWISARKIIKLSKFVCLSYMCSEVAIWTQTCVSHTHAAHTRGQIAPRVFALLMIFCSRLKYRTNSDFYAGLFSRDFRPPCCVSKHAPVNVHTNRSGIRFAISSVCFPLNRSQIIDNPITWATCSVFPQRNGLQIQTHSTSICERSIHWNQFKRKPNVSS